MANALRLSKSNTPQEKRPVIAQVLPALVRGGVERGTVEMAQAIQNAGGRAIVVSAGGPLERHIVRCGATHHTLPVNVKNPMKWGSTRRKLQQIFKDEGGGYCPCPLARASLDYIASCQKASHCDSQYSSWPLSDTFYF